MAETVGRAEGVMPAGGRGRVMFSRTALGSTVEATVEVRGVAGYSQGGLGVDLGL